MHADRSTLLSLSECQATPTLVFLGGRKQRKVGARSNYVDVLTTGNFSLVRERKIYLQSVIAISNYVVIIMMRVYHPLRRWRHPKVRFGLDGYLVSTVLMYRRRNQTSFQYCLCMYVCYIGLWWLTSSLLKTITGKGDYEELCTFAVYRALASRPMCVVMSLLHHGVGPHLSRLSNRFHDLSRPSPFPFPIYNPHILFTTVPTG